MYQNRLTIETAGRGFIEITDRIAGEVQRAGIGQGLCNLFIQHTSASLLITENADPDVRTDLETFMAGLVPDGDPRYVHRAEGPDDMAAHVRSLLTVTSLTVPITAGRPALGTWQGIFLWEQRRHPHRRSIVVTLHGT